MYQIPIIDREIFSANSNISSVQISPDGQYISFLKALNGVHNIWLKKKKGFNTSFPITSVVERPITTYFWSRDSRNILFFQDIYGDENYHIYLIEIEKKQSNHFPAIIDLTPYSRIRAVLFKKCKTNSTELIIGINDRDPAWHDLYIINIYTRKRELILKNDKFFSNFFFDQEDQLRLVSRSLSNGGTELLKKVGERWLRCYLTSYEDSVSILSINKDIVYLASNKGARDLTGLTLLDLRSDIESEIEIDPLKKVDLSSIFFSEAQEKIIATIYIDTKKRIYWRDKDYQNDYQYACSILNTEEIWFYSCTIDEREWIIYKEEDIDPGTFYYFNRNTRQLLFLYKTLPSLLNDHLCRMSPIKYYSSDQLSITAYLTFPSYNRKELFPAIILVHGGPWTRDYWGYNKWVQFLANRGYVVLQPNFRGSTGYGKKFLNAGNREWGSKMQEDITSGARYLVNNALVDPKRIAIMGWSYGGYSALAGLTFTPSIYACGICIGGPSNLLTLLENTLPYWESARKLFYKRIGNPNTLDGKQRLYEQSPLFNVHKICAPLLIIHGNNDLRVRKDESDQFVKAIHNSGVEVNYLSFPNEGHDFVNPKNLISCMAVIEKFLAHKIGGRYQDTLTEELEEIIKNAAIDPLSL